MCHPGLTPVTCHPQDGAELHFKIKRSTPMRKLISAYCKKQGRNALELRFMCPDGYQIYHESDATPDTMGLEDRDVIEVMRMQSGMISNFNFTDTSDPLVKWLMLTDAQRADDSSAARPPSKQLLQFAMTSKWANPTKSHEIRATGETLLTTGQRRRCIEFLDAARASLSPLSADVKIVLGQGAFLALFGVKSQAQHDKLLALHPGSSKIALRRTEGPVEGCIGFHIDGGYATHTVQLTLNDCSEYEGGRLCFVTGANATLSVPPRPAGTLTKHDSDILHGVTKLHRGVRYSLFVVDDSNGLGEQDVHQVDEAMVSRTLVRTLPTSRGRSVTV